MRTLVARAMKADEAWFVERVGAWLSPSRFLAQGRSCADWKPGRIARSRKVVLPVNLPIKPLHSAGDVADLLGETINQVRRGDNRFADLQRHRVLSGVLLRRHQAWTLDGKCGGIESALKRKFNNMQVGG